MSTSSSEQDEQGGALEDSKAALEEARVAAAKVDQTRNPADNLDLPGPGSTPPGSAAGSGGQ